MRFDMVMLPTHYPDLDPPFARYYANLLDHVQLAEDLGWQCAWWTEHHFVPYGGPVPNPAVFITAAAARTSRIRLGCSVSVLPLHHPLQVAEDYAMADVVSGGRLEFGMGVGNNPYEYAARGISFEEGRARFAEAQQVILAAWANERVSHRGTFWQFDEVSVYPRPVQRPHPPLWLAGSSETSMRRAGQLGFNMMSVAHPRPPEDVRPGYAAWQAGLVEGGHDPADRHCLIHMRVHVHENAERAREVAESAISRYDRISAQARGRPVVPPDQYDWKGMLASGRNIYGNPDQCIAAMHRCMENFDFDIFGMQFYFGGIPHDEAVKSMRLFTREVIPACQ
jgi:alkanesulfonate monooxygenase SsuD/methylene tetrahydromethanopterin reductase-like flavin-dependent oxidoreductase (luciferase family)